MTFLSSVAWVGFELLLFLYCSSAGIGFVCQRAWLRATSLGPVLFCCAGESGSVFLGYPGDGGSGSMMFLGYPRDRSSGSMMLLG